jgi:hypothetical protein
MQVADATFDMQVGVNLLKHMLREHVYLF